jgi:hypothetical protein
MTPQETISAIAGPTGSIGAAFYFHPNTLATGKELGLDGFRWYVLGRGGALGDVHADVVQSAFGYFNPDLIAKLWNSAREKVDPKEAGQRFFDCCAERGRELLAGADGLDAYCAAADAVIDAMPRAGLPLFAGTAALRCADDPAGRAMQKAAVLRELRGSAHLCGVLAVGLSDRIAHLVQRPNDQQMFGWEDAPEIPADANERMAEAERITDVIVTPAFAVLDDAQSSALVDGTTAMAAALGIG